MADEDAVDSALDSVFDSGRDRGGNAAPPVEDKPLSQPRDESGRFAPKTEQSAAPTPEVEEDDDAPTPEPEADDNRMVPTRALQAERDKRKQEARLRAEAEARATGYADQLTRLLQQQRQDPTPRQQPPPPPDPLTDPEGAYAYQQNHFSQRILSAKLDQSEMMARDKYGDEKVDEAFEVASRAGIIGNFVRSKHPYRDLVQWHEKAQAFQKIGPDPEAYAKKLREDIRAEVLAELKAGKGPAAAPVPRLPGSLADATQAGAQGAHLSDEAMMAGVFGSDRKRRA